MTRGMFRFVFTGVIAVLQNKNDPGTKSGTADIMLSCSYHDDETQAESLRW